MIHIIPALTEIDPEIVDALHEAARAVLTYEDVDEETTDLVICIEGDEKVLELNRDFRRVAATTDVLAFPAHEIDPESGRTHLGDVIISYPRAVAQAQAARHPLVTELQLLTVHGVLHVLGYDHQTAEEHNHMWATQRIILNQIGCKLAKEPGKDD